MTETSKLAKKKKKKKRKIETENIAQQIWVHNDQMASVGPRWDLPLPGFVSDSRKLAQLSVLLPSLLQTSMAILS